MKNVFDLIVLGVTFTAWLVYTYPPLYYSPKRSAIRAQLYLRYVISAGMGYSFGAALGVALGVALGGLT